MIILPVCQSIQPAMSEVSVSVTDCIAQLDSILDAHAIDEVGITLDASLPSIFYTEGKLGIAKTILKPLFKHALETVYRIKLSENASVDVCKETLSITRVVLLIKGDFPIAFGMRKKLVQMNVLSVKDEITFTSLLYTRHPKCPSGWHHRRWCLKRNKRSQDAVLSAAEIETERELCRLMAEKHPKNYYAWMHRLWVMKFMSRFQLEDELFFTKTWLQSHVSDHSAVNHRLQVIRHILAQPETLVYVLQSDNTPHESAGEVLWVAFLEQQFKESEELIRKRPGHEALWYLRRSLLELLYVKVSEVATISKSLWCESGGQVVSAEFASALSLSVQESSATASGDVSPSTGSASPCQAFAQLSELVSSPHASLPTTAPPTCAVGWLVSLLTYEMRLAAQCASDTEAWDYAAQRAMATRYAAFLLDRTAHHIAASSAVGVVQDVPGQSVREVQEDGVLNLSRAVAQALLQVCTTLQSEDSFTRIWNYKRAQPC